MRQPKIETMGDVTRAVDWMAGHFEIPPPIVVAIVGHHSRAVHKRDPEVLAGRRPATLRIGCWDWHGLEMATLHEFAHALAFTRGERRHGPHFVVALERVVTFWLGDPAAYDWHTEYLSVYTWGRQSGYTTKPWHRAKVLPEGVEPYRIGEFVDRAAAREAITEAGR